MDEYTAFGVYEGYPTEPPKNTAFDWLTTILNGANNALKQLFPYGLNNQGQIVNTGQYYPQSSGGNNSNNNMFLYLLLGLAVVYFLTKDSK